MRAFSQASQTVEGAQPRRPFFSIGVTTYNRPDLLKETLSSITGQTFSAFEVIVGNDYTREPLSAKLLGIEDSRIRFINHSENLGEVKNMNCLLGVARGQYFTWLADDDMYVPAFLESVHASLVKFDFPLCVFTSYASGAAFPDELKSCAGEGQLFKGPVFLRLYLARKLKTIGCYGVFDAEYVKQIDGIEQLGDGFSPYSDNLLVIKSGSLEKVSYIDAPLIFYRTHEQSISSVSTDVGTYISAQKDLLSKSIEVFRSDKVKEDFHRNLFLLLAWCIRDLATVVLRSGSINKRQIMAYLLFLRRHFRLLKGSDFYWKGIILLSADICHATVSLVWNISRRKLVGSYCGQKKRLELLRKKDNSLG